MCVILVLRHGLLIQCVCVCVGANTDRPPALRRVRRLHVHYATLFVQEGMYSEHYTTDSSYHMLGCTFLTCCEQIKLIFCTYFNTLNQICIAFVLKCRLIFWCGNYSCFYPSLLVQVIDSIGHTSVKGRDRTHLWLASWCVNYSVEASNACDRPFVYGVVPGHGQSLAKHTGEEGFSSCHSWETRSPLMHMETFFV